MITARPGRPQRPPATQNPAQGIGHSLLHVLGIRWERDPHPASPCGVEEQPSLRSLLHSRQAGVTWETKNGLKMMLKNKECSGSAPGFIECFKPVPSRQLCALSSAGSPQNILNQQQRGLSPPRLPGAEHNSTVKHRSPSTPPSL